MDAAAPLARPNLTPAVDHCPEGAVNSLARNYGPFPDPGMECPVHLSFWWRNPDWPSGWMPVGEFTDVGWMGALYQAHRLMFRVGQCGVILHGIGGWESPGVFYVASADLHLELFEVCPGYSWTERTPSVALRSRSR